MNITTGLRTFVAAALLVSPLCAALAQDGSAKKDEAKPAAAAPETPAAPAAAEKKDDVAPIKLETDEDKFSYLIGADIGTNLKGNRIPFIRERFLLGFNDITAGKEPAMTDQEIGACIEQYKKVAGDKPADPAAPPQPITGDEKFLGQLSYIVGADTGMKLKQSSLEVKTETFLRAIEDVNAGRKLAMTEEEMKTVLDSHRQKLMEKRKAAADKNLADGKAFLAENAKKPGVKSTTSGLQYLVVTEGKGESPKATDEVTTHYRGTTIDGKEFDSSYARNEPAVFPVNQVIKGWTEALQLMHVGDKWKLFIPSDLAYGERGAGADIGPNSVLVFDIELLEVKKAEAPAAAPSDGTIKLDAGTGDAKAK